MVKIIILASCVIGSLAVPRPFLFGSSRLASKLSVNPRNQTIPDSTGHFGRPNRLSLRILKTMQSDMLDEYNPFSSDTTFLDQVISDLIDETIEARGIVPGGFEIEVSELTLPFFW